MRVVYTRTLKPLEFAAWEKAAAGLTLPTPKTLPRRQSWIVSFDANWRLKMTYAPSTFSFAYADTFP